jgi:hypothetical protein
MKNNNVKSHNKPTISYRAFNLFTIISAIVVSFCFFIILSFEYSILTFISFVIARFFLKISLVNHIYYRKKAFSGVENYTVYTTETYDLSFIDKTKILHREDAAAVRKPDNNFYTRSLNKDLEFWVNNVFFNTKELDNQAIKELLKEKVLSLKLSKNIKSFK